MNFPTSPTTSPLEKQQKKNILPIQKMSIDFVWVKQTCPAGVDIKDKIIQVPDNIPYILK